MTERTPHGVPNQINIFVRDRNSDITGHGKHKRVVVGLLTASNTIHARVDHIEADAQLPWPTVDQVLRVCNGWQRMHPRRSRLDLLSDVHQRHRRYLEFAIITQGSRRASAPH